MSRGKVEKVAQSKITKAEIIENIHEKVGVSRKNIHEILDLFLEEVKGALTRDDIVELRGFGTFEIKTRKGREKARNPKTGEKVSVKNHGVASFRPGRELKTLVWSLRE